jgi:hypothetical protein
MGAAGANVERKWLFNPVSSLGSGSIKGSISACLACQVSFWIQEQMVAPN